MSMSRSRSGQALFVNHFAVRTTTEPAALLATVRREVAALDPTQAVTSVKRRQLFSENVARPRFDLGLLASLAGGSRGLGIYGVISYSVALRTREIKCAVGGSAHERGDVLRLVLKQGLTLILNGLAMHLVAAFLWRG